MNCTCKVEETTGWTTVKCCNVCGLPIPGEVWESDSERAVGLKNIVSPVTCGYCIDCKHWNDENVECKNDIIWLNRDKNVFFNISDIKTSKFFGCIKFESKLSG